MTNTGNFCSLQLIQVPFARTKNYTFSTSAEHDFQCYGTLQREGKGSMALLGTEVRTALFDKMQYCVPYALKFLPLEVKWEEAFI